MPNYTYVILIPALPLITFLVLGLFGKKYFNKTGGIIGSLSLAGSTFLSMRAGWQYFFSDGKVAGVFQKIEPLKFTWLSFSPNLSIDMGIIIDPISVMMLVVVSFVSLMVHLFSLGYMKGEERFATYYAFLSLFTFSMLGLVLSTNIFQVYVFWELVGVSSFLLIGYYYHRPSAVAASKKAFIVTRFADLGFLIGILILGFYGGSMDIGTLIQRFTASDSEQFVSISTASFLGLSALTWGLVLVFIGGAGKSAMFPLHIWLPDAMEGPTPVSALIHAATMVVAGVYLVARLFPIYAIEQTTLTLVTYVGAFSALMAALIACTQTDIKRVLAYSTMSQIGYMMFALGLSSHSVENNLGFTASLFHLFTHAFFKSLLFLAAGAVIHMVHSNEMKDMGGLRKLMPVTHFGFVIACLAIAGIPPFAGFFSKEEILLSAYHSNIFIYGIALLTSAITAFYMFRLYFNIFWNTPVEKWNTSHESHYHEGTLTMKVPLIALAVCSLAAGFIPFSHWVTASGLPMPTHIDIAFSVLPVLLACAGIFTAFKLYKKQSEKPGKIQAAFGGIFTTVKNKFYIDEFYLFMTKKIIFNGFGRPAAWIDKNIVDGLMNGLAKIIGSISQLIKGWQSGKVQQYAIYFFAGIAGLSLLFIYWWK